MINKKIKNNLFILIITIVVNILMSINVFAKEKELETGVYKIPYIIPNSLESKRDFFEASIIKAQKNLKIFAKQHNWENLVKESFADLVEVYDKKIQFDQRIIYLSDADLDTQLPITYSAALEKRVLISVSPDLYKENYPDGIEKDSFEKLLIHEMAHRLHIRILKGNEEKMGPIWFFEGFAIYVANQFENKDLTITKEEVWSILENKERGSYKKYAAVMKYFLKKLSLEKMVKMAGEKNFIDLLKVLDNKPL